MSEEKLFSHRLATKARLTQMLKTIQRLRSQYEGLPSRENREKLLNIIERKKIENDEFQREILDLKRVNLELLDQTEKLEEQNKGKDEMISILKDEKSSRASVDRLSDWTSRFTQLRLDNRSLMRKVRELEAEKSSLHRKCEESYFELTNAEMTLTGIQAS